MHQTEVLRFENHILARPGIGGVTHTSAGVKGR